MRFPFNQFESFVRLQGCCMLPSYLAYFLLSSCVAFGLLNIWHSKVNVLQGNWRTVTSVDCPTSIYSCGKESASSANLNSNSWTRRIQSFLAEVKYRFYTIVDAFSKVRLFDVSNKVQIIAIWLNCSSTQRRVYILNLLQGDSQSRPEFGYVSLSTAFPPCTSRTLPPVPQMFISKEKTEIDKKLLSSHPSYFSLFLFIFFSSLFFFWIFI